MRRARAVRAGRLLAHPGPLGRRPGGRLGGAALDGRHQEPRAGGRPGDAAGRDGQRHHRHAGVVDAAQLGRRRAAAGRRAAWLPVQPAPRGRPRRRRRVSGRSARPTTSCQRGPVPAGSRSVSVSHRRTGAQRDAGSRRRGRDRLGEPSDAADQPGEDRHLGARRRCASGVRGARRRAASRAAGRAPGSAARPPPARGRRRGRRRPRPAAARAAGRAPRVPSRCATYAPADVSSPCPAPRRRPGSDPFQAGAGHRPPGQDTAAGQRSEVARHTEHGGRQRPQRRRATRRPPTLVAGWQRSSPRPTSRTRSTASGRRLSSDSAPVSTGRPASSPRASLPPSADAASSTVTRTPSALSRWAAASPAMPPPTTTTCGPPGVGSGRSAGTGPWSQPAGRRPRRGDDWVTLRPAEGTRTASAPSHRHSPRTVERGSAMFSARIRSTVRSRPRTAVALLGCVTADGHRRRLLGRRESGSDSAGQQPTWTTRPRRPKQKPSTASRRTTRWAFEATSRRPRGTGGLAGLRAGRRPARPARHHPHRLGVARRRRPAGRPRPRRRPASTRSAGTCPTSRHRSAPPTAWTRSGW